MPNKDNVSLGITLRQTLRGHRTVIEQIGWSPNGRMLVSASSNVDKTIRLWDPQTGECLRIFRGALRPNLDRGLVAGRTDACLWLRLF